MRDYSCFLKTIMLLFHSLQQQHNDMNVSLRLITESALTARLYTYRHVCIGKHDIGRGVCQHFGLIGFIATKFYSDSFSTKKHSLDYYHCIIWLYYCLPLLYIIAP